MKTIYDQFIDHLQIKEKEYYSKISFSKKIFCLENHHILPLHAGGTNSPENIVRVSIEDHALAHFYRYLALGQKQDKLAYYFRRNDTNSAVLLRAQLSLATRKKRDYLIDSKIVKNKLYLVKKVGKLEVR